MEANLPRTPVCHRPHRQQHPPLPPQPAPPLRLAVRHEGGGLTAAARNTATRTVKIPMSGATESLNVAMAATVCLFEQLRQRSE